MKYMLLIYHAEPTGPMTESPEFREMTQEYFALNERMKADGVYVAGDALQPTATATVLKVRDGKPETMDGPYAETKEQLGGYYIVDCADLDQALEYAAMIPAARFGQVEVRPLVVFG